MGCFVASDEELFGHRGEGLEGTEYPHPGFSDYDLRAASDPDTCSEREEGGRAETSDVDEEGAKEDEATQTESRVGG